jgi:predicted HTH domain antitoxin
MVNSDQINDLLNNLPDVRDGFNRKERVVLYMLHELQKELKGRNVPTVMLYGRVVEVVDMSEDEFQTILARFIGGVN